MDLIDLGLFHFSFCKIDIASCSMYTLHCPLISGDSGVIESSGLSRGGGCKWLLRVDDGFGIKLTFESFSVRCLLTLPDSSLLSSRLPAPLVPSWSTMARMTAALVQTTVTLTCPASSSQPTPPCTSSTPAPTPGIASREPGRKWRVWRVENQF